MDRCDGTRRTRAMVKACEGISTEALEAGVSPCCLAERERCAKIAEKRLKDAEGTYEILEKMGDAEDGSLALLAGEAQAAGSIAAAIRGESATWLTRE